MTLQPVCFNMPLKAFDEIICDIFVVREMLRNDKNIDIMAASPLHPFHHHLAVIILLLN